MSVLRNFFSCMGDHHGGTTGGGPNQPEAPTKVRFGLPLKESFKEGILPQPLKELLVIIARDGMSTNDLFRRPGNPQDMKKILKRMEEGKPIMWHEYNFYTLANVVKRFLLRIPGGMFGLEIEELLLESYFIEDPNEQLDTVNSILTSLAEPVQQLVALLFGIWFRMIHHSEYNKMHVEAVAKSVAGSVFQSCTSDPTKVNCASQVVELLISNFGVTNMFGARNVQFFANSTQTGICTRETFKYEYSYPPSDIVPLETLAAISEEEFHETRRRSNTYDEGSISSRKPSMKEKHQPLQRLLSNKSQTNSMSAPEVSKSDERLDASRVLAINRSQTNPEQPISPAIEDMSEGMFNSISLGRFELVRRRQLAQLERRSNWFLAQPCTISIDSRFNRFGSRVTANSLGSSGMATSSDFDILDTKDSCENIFGERRTAPSSEPVARKQPQKNAGVHSGYHATERVEEAQEEPMEIDTTHDSEDLDKKDDDADGEKSDLTDKEVRYFLVENWYNGNKQSSNMPDKPGSGKP
ncbi:uncharacterized protein LOC135488843 isoform X2 [Lineus longissimus]|uniref:uncharacterized protein LOC135488843 isoform X2 n=1 Tax=Lineus longissimus TaxID=88925 RepID=UPI00315C8FB0